MKKIVRTIWFSTEAARKVVAEREAARKAEREAARKAGTSPGTAGEAVSQIILPSDPNALVERLKLLIGAYDAGNTGVADEAIAICDELLREGSLDKESYKEFLKQLNRL